MEYQYKDRELTTGRNSITPSKAVSDYVWQRDSGICIYCGNPAQVLDHVIRWADNGSGISSNLVCSCQKCNIYKGKHPRGLKQLTRAIFWLMTHDEDVSWMDKFYPEVEANLKRPKEYIFDKEKLFNAKELKQKEPVIVKPKIKNNHNRNNRTTVVAFRLPNDVLVIVKRRAIKRGMTIAEYLRWFITTDILRKR